MAPSRCSGAGVAVRSRPGQRARRPDGGPVRAPPAPHGSGPPRGGGWVRQKTGVQNVWETVLHYISNLCFLSVPF